ncbi:MAG: hypothetical protein RBR37_05295 [Advenella sp.]|nr:hypothetical protein [Advenella sp.]
METIVDQQLPKFETRGRVTRINFNEQQVTREQEGTEPKTFWKYTTAVFPVTAPLRQRVNAIIRTAYPTDSDEARAADTHEYQSFVALADRLARESLGQTLSDEYLREARRCELQRERDARLMAMVYTFEDGAVVQVRPQDIANFQTAIASGIDRTWIMADNSVRMTTVAELQAAMADGVEQGQQIWDNYADQMAALNDGVE